MKNIRKEPPAPGYPPEEGCYLRGNDFSPVAVCVILKWEREKTPPEIEHLVRVGVESGAALSGTLQTENVGLEKVICNVVANPNIRHLVLFGPESPGHLVGAAILALAANGIDANKRIVAAKAPTPYLFNILPEFVERFRQQVTPIDLIDEGDPQVLRQAVQACYQEAPTAFRGRALHDPGAFPQPPLSGTITWRVSQPDREPKSDAERQQTQKLEDMMARISRAVETKQGGDGDKCSDE